jgi:hypothetical protein
MIYISIGSFAGDDERPLAFAKTIFPTTPPPRLRSAASEKLSIYLIGPVNAGFDQACADGGKDLRDERSADSGQLVRRATAESRANHALAAKTEFVEIELRTAPASRPNVDDASTDPSGARKLREQFTPEAIERYAGAFSIGSIADDANHLPKRY